MATVLESLAVPRSSALPSSGFPSLGSSPVCSLSGRRGLARLPEFSGLKIQPSLASRPLASAGRSSRFSRRLGGGVVCEAQDTALEVPAVTAEDWQKSVIEAESPVLVEFWAPWCGPCRMIHPIINELAKEYTGKLKCYKVNTDESPSIATRYGIRSIPTVIIFKSGEKKEAVIGAVPKSTLTTSIEKFL